VGLAVFGYISSCFIPLAPPAAPDLKINWNPATETWRILKFTYQNFTVFSVGARHFLVLVSGQRLFGATAPFSPGSAWAAASM
jgi:hypothetical protein